MSFIVEGVKSALELISEPVVIEITLSSIKVSGMAVLISALWALPVGVVIGMFDFRGKRLIKGFFNGLIGIPTVVLGLILYLILSPKGPFGFLGLLYTEMGISIGQSILISPIIVSIVSSSVEMVGREIRDLVLTLGGGRIDLLFSIAREALGGVILGIVSAFNRAIAELGIALMVGGNVFVKGSALNTRVLTTAIQMYTARGEIELAIALGVILLGIVMVISLISNLLQGISWR